MKRTLWLLVAAIALAGCGDDPADSVQDTCPAETHFVDGAGVCTAHTPATIIVEGMPSTLQQYAEAEFSWRLDNGTYSKLHSMDNRILANTENTPTTNATEADDWGFEVAVKTHQDLPSELTGTFSSEETGTYYLRGFMEIDGENIWIDLGSIDVVPVAATGNRTAVTISAFGDAGAPALSSTSEDVTVGDGVTITNNNEAVTYTVTLSGDDCPSGPATLAPTESADFDFIVPGACTIDLTTPLSDGSDGALNQGDLSLKVNVRTP